MTDINQKKLGSTSWGIADQLRGEMDADDFRSATGLRLIKSKRIHFVASRN
jgi:hypothetical protein